MVIPHYIMCFYEQYFLQMISITVYVKLLTSGMQHCIVNFTTSIIMIYYIFMIMSLLKSLLMCTHLFITTNFSCNDGLIVLISAFMTDKQIALNCHFLMWIVNDGRWQGITLFSFIMLKAICAGKSAYLLLVL